MTMICPCYQKDFNSEADNLLQNEEEIPEVSTLNKIKNYFQNFFSFSKDHLLAESTATSSSSIQFNEEGQPTLAVQGRISNCNEEEIPEVSTLNKIKNYFQNFFSFSKDHLLAESTATSSSSIQLNEEGQPDSTVHTTLSHCKEIISKSINPLFIKGLLFGGSVATTTIISFHLANLINAITENCYEAQMLSPEAFDLCNAPFEKRLIVYNAILATSSLYLGYALHKTLETDSNQSLLDEHFDGNLETISDSELRIQEFRKKAQKFIEKHRYEICIGTGWLYNGIGIPVGSPSSFTAFQACMSAGLGVCGLLAGNYLRAQEIEGTRLLYKRNHSEIHQLDTLRSLRKEWKILVINSLAAGVFASTWIAEKKLSPSFTEIVREICILVIANSFGKMISYIIINKNSTNNSLCKKINDLVIRLLHLHIPFVIASYGIYFTSTHDCYRFSGISLLGVTQGIQQQSYKKTYPRKNCSFTDHATAFCQKVIKVFKNHIGSGLLLSFVIVCDKFQFLNCKGRPSPMNYSCPIGLEISGYLEPNQIVIESRGVNLAIEVGLAHYYVRRIIRYVNKKLSKNPIQKFLNSYIDLSDRWQFQLISMIPYFLAKSAQYTTNYADFYSVNPILPLAITGFTFATYKEQFLINNEAESIKNQHAEQD